MLVNLVIILLLAAQTGLSVSEGNQTETVSKWFNKGAHYAHCKDADSKIQLETCSKFDFTNENFVDETPIQSMTCDRMLKKLACSLQRLNCPDMEPRSFMVYNMACQASCFAAVSMCMREPFSVFEHQAPTAQEDYQEWTDPGEFSSSNDPNDFWAETYSSPNFEENAAAEIPWNRGQRSSNFQQLNNWDYNRGGYQPSTSYRPRSSYPLWRQRRSQQVQEPRQQTWYPQAQYSPQYQGSFYSSSYYPSTQQERNRRAMISPWTDTRTPERLRVNNVADSLYSSCLLLPAGGCEDWMQNLTWIPRNQRFQLYARTQVNRDCKEIGAKCRDMFPAQRFSQENFKQGNFTVAVIIKVIQTLWSLGEDGSYQAMFRFTVSETLHSNIQHYDPNKIVSMPWPLKCPCPNELTVGKSYLMLTHAKPTRHRFTLTNKTVFLSRHKFYTKQLQCWLEGKCSNRRRRFSVFRNP